MKKLILVTTLSLLIGTLHAQVTNVLFIGNSYTGVNNLPSLVQNVALSLGDTIFTDANTPGGATLNNQSTNTTTLSKIAQGTWDYVVLQAQSQEPAFPPFQVASQTYPYAQILADSIRSANPCTEPVFFMTWGRKNGDASNCASYPPICTYEGMQQRLKESYLEMSVNNLTTVSPVGVAWKHVRDSFPSIELYNPDESHPSIYGSYLAACVFYTTLYQNSPIGASYIPAGISTSDALNLQTVASYTVLDSLSLWRVNANLPVANFNYSGGGTINFTNSSTNGVSYFWDFGDGNTSTLSNPSHTYSISNTYPVQLITFSHDSCFSDTITQNVVVTITSIADEIDNKNSITIYPNPADNFVIIQTKLDFTSIQITTITGKIVANYKKQYKIDIESLQPGIYFLSIQNKAEVLQTYKLVKQ